MRKLVAVVAFSVFSGVISPAITQEMRQTRGKVSLLRINHVGSMYGPPGDRIDAEVIIQLAGRPAEAFGFQLRNDVNRLVHQGMLDLLRDAFNYDHRIWIDYSLVPGKRNALIRRVRLTRD